MGCTGHRDSARQGQNRLWHDAWSTRHSAVQPGVRLGRTDGGCRAADIDTLADEGVRTPGQASATIRQPLAAFLIEAHHQIQPVVKPCLAGQTMLHSTQAVGREAWNTPTRPSVCFFECYPHRFWRNPRYHAVFNPVCHPPFQRPAGLTLRRLTRLPPERPAV